MRMIASSNRSALARFIDRSPARDPAVLRRAARIVARVRTGGDAVLRSYARRLDGVTGDFVITERDMRREVRDVPRSVRLAIASAAKSVRRVSARQLPRGWTIEAVPGVRIEQRITPLDRVGCYVPGGRYPLPSSLLMTAVPAIEAGVREVVVACPRPDAVVMCAALEAGVTQLLRIGGAHAIAALAYGTETVRRVDKIVGPGNVYVAAAKSLVASDCPIDFHAGPSEILVLSTTGRPEWIAADLIAQAEHDPDARAIAITPRRALAAAIDRAVARRLPSVPAASAALERHGAIVVTRTLEEAIEWAERMAPEHAVCDSMSVARRLTRAGTVFVGGSSAQALGDYATGSNHVLPTNGAARFRGGLSAADFVRATSVQCVSKPGLHAIGPVAISLAEAEGLRGHADSIRIRMGDAS